MPAASPPKANGCAPRAACSRARYRRRSRHCSSGITAFQTLLQKNLTVLATAHAVSEGIIRGVSDELARKRAPSTYGASGRANTPNPQACQPLALSRTL